MAIEIDPYLRQAIDENQDNPRKVRGIAAVRAYMWGQVAKGRFPEHIKGFSEVQQVYSHPMFDFVSSDGRLIVNGDIIPLTFTETRLLTALCGKLNRVASRTALLAAINHDPALDDPRIINVHMSHLRRKISHGRDLVSPIEVVPGIGYRLVDPTVPNGYGNSNGNGVYHP